MKLKHKLIMTISLITLERDTDGEFKSVYPDKNNHTIDAVRYALEDEITKKKARVIKRSELDL